ncbi:MAG: hypothetical protein FRX49_08749 [Trebouxia sp. A1-2]|nr:MAG: hypothetical protein FRX49_08749 [Trebouxia sp. A1-2]
MLWGGSSGAGWKGKGAKAVAGAWERTVREVLKLRNSLWQWRDDPGSNDVQAKLCGGGVYTEYLTP